MRVLLHLEVDAQRTTRRLVYLEAHLHAVEVDGARCHAPFTQYLGEGVELHQLGGILALTCFQDVLHLLVGEASVAPDYGVRDVRVADVALVVDAEDDGVRQLLLVGAQRADEVAQPLGQHRHGAVHEVD